MSLVTNPTANVDGSIVLTTGGPGAPRIGIGVLASDAQHGVRGGGGIHALATTLVAGFLPITEKANLDGLVAGTTQGSSFFGDGADGAVTLGAGAVTQPLTRASTFHATGAVSPQTNKTGFMLRATSTVTIDGGASLNADGVGTGGTAGGAGGAPGAAGTNKVGVNETQIVANPATVAGGTAGTGGAIATVGNPGNSPLAPGNTLQGGSGGGGAGGGGSTAATGANGGNGGAQATGTAFDEFRWQRIRFDPLMLADFSSATGVVVGVGGCGGGGGGNGGGAGGAGGAGGNGTAVTGAGFVYVAAPALTGAGLISANGTTGTTGTVGAAGAATQGGGGGGGGSGGGAGGYLNVITKSLGGGLTVQANGGAGGAGGGGGAGGAGGAGGGTGATGAAGGAGKIETTILA